MRINLLGSVFLFFLKSICEIHETSLFALLIDIAFDTDAGIQRTLKYLLKESINKSVNVWRRLSRLLLFMYSLIRTHLKNTHYMLVTMLVPHCIIQLLQAKYLCLTTLKLVEYIFSKFLSVKGH